MPINFNELPETRSYGLNEPGKYIAKIEEAEMRSPKSGKADYLNLTLTLQNFKGKPSGKFWIKLFEPTADFTKWQLRRFMQAVELNLPVFELRDLPQTVNRKIFHPRTENR